MSFIFTTNSTAAPRRREKVADWAGSKKRLATVKKSSTLVNNNDWKDVHNNIKQMDQFYDATFYAWLKSEENVLVTSIYLHRIANEYPLERIMNALEWLTNDWRWESTSILVRNVTVDWCDDEGDVKRANLLTKLTSNWATHYIATLITTILISAPYSSCSITKRELFLREFTKDWDFSKLSEFFMFLRSRANIDYKFKCLMLQEAARKDGLMSNTNKKKSDTSNTTATSVTTALTNNSNNTNHRRTSSNDYQDIKKSIAIKDDSSCSGSGSSSSSSNGTIGNNNISGSSGSNINSNNATASSSTSTSSRYHHHHHSTTTVNTPRLLSASSSTITLNNLATSTTSSSATDLLPSPSSSTNNSNDKKRITLI